MTAPTPLAPPAPPAPPKIVWSRNSNLFREFLTQGFKYQRFVGDFFLANGLDVVMPRQRFRKSIAAAKDFKDEADLVVSGKVIEVKSRALDFQRNLELPTSVLIDTTESWESKTHKPYAYILVSQVTGAMVWTQGSDKSKWSIVKTFDKKRQIPIVCYATRRFEFEPIKTLVAALRGTDAQQGTDASK